MEEKTLIQNGIVIDGTGAEPEKRSLLIDKCSISATGSDADKFADQSFEFPEGQDYISILKTSIYICKHSRAKNTR